MPALATARLLVTMLIGLGVLAVAVVALVDALRRPEGAFTSEGKRTKKFWLLVLGAGLLVAVLGALRMVSIVLNLAALAPAAVYWSDVRPEVQRHGTGRSRAAVGRGAAAGLGKAVGPKRAPKLPRKVEVPDYYDPADWDK